MTVEQDRIKYIRNNEIDAFVVNATYVMQQFGMMHTVIAMPLNGRKYDEVLDELKKMNNPHGVLITREPKRCWQTMMMPAALPGLPTTQAMLSIARLPDDYEDDCES